MRRHIFIGLCPIVLLIVAMGAYAILLFAKLGTRVDVILRENYGSVVAGQTMKESAERMDSGLFFSLVGEEKLGREMYLRNKPVFEEALQSEMNNITLPGEGDLARKVEDIHRQYSAKVDLFWKTADLQERRSMYFHEMLPEFTLIKDTASQIIMINQDNMVKADHDARQLSEQSIRYMICAILIGVVTAAFFGVRLQKAILQPIQTLTAVSKELGEGKLDQVVPFNSRDELGGLADAFNKMAAKLRVYRQVTSDQLVHARQMMETTFSAFPDPIVILSPEGVINFTNPAATTLFQKIGSMSHLPPPVQKSVDEVLQGAPDYLPVSFEKAVMVKVDDREVFLLPRVIGIRDESMKLLGGALILQDVTRFRLLDEVKTNLVSTVSHELKTPLTGVRMGLHLLLEERIGDLNPKQTELLLAAREDSERLLGMINDLLDLAKLESGKLYLNPESINAGDLVYRVVENLRPFAESHGSRLAIDVEPNLPMVSVDRKQIGYVFSNLVANAVKHKQHGDQVVMVARNLNGRIRFSVIDQGPGIPEEFQSQIFERFFCLPGGKSSGAGLGLAIAKEIIMAHGGSIGVVSQPGEGSEFYFDLPSQKSPLAS